MNGTLTRFEAPRVSVVFLCIKVITKLIVRRSAHWHQEQFCDSYFPKFAGYIRMQSKEIVIVPGENSP